MKIDIVDEELSIKKAKRRYYELNSFFWEDKKNGYLNHTQARTYLTK